MLVSFEKIEDFSTHGIDFYTVRLGENELTEFELFDAKDFPDHGEELEIMYNAIELMQTKGAKQFYFKDERGANAIPIVTRAIKNANKKDWGIRLYCIRLTDNLIVLLNGGIKTKENPEECPNVKKHFLNAVSIAAKLDRLIINREISFQDQDCLSDITLEI